MKGSKPKYPGKQKIRKAQGEQFRQWRINELGKGQDMVDLSQAKVYACGEGTFNVGVLRGMTGPGLPVEKLEFVTSPTLTLRSFVSSQAVAQHQWLRKLMH
jgi:hypothetical protein